MKNVKNFEIAKVSPQGAAWHLPEFCQFQSGVAYKSVTHKKKRVPPF